MAVTHALIFATRHVVEKKKRKDIRIPIFVDAFMPEAKETFYQDLQSNAGLQKKCRILKEQGYEITYAEYNKENEELKTSSNYADLNKAPLTPSDDNKLNYYIRSAIQEGTAYSISRPLHRQPKTKIGPISALRYVTNKIFGGLLGRIILKAQTKEFLIEGWSPSGYTNFFLEKNKDVLYAKRRKVFKPESTMETVELRLKTQDKTDPKNTMYILNVPGYDQCFQQKLDEMKKDLIKLNKKVPTRVIGFNFGNVADSEDSSPKTKKDDCVADLMTQVQRLREKGVPAKNIVIKGYSLGAGMGVKAAQHLHRQKDKVTQENFPVNYFNGRSFDRLSSAVTGWIRTGKKSGVKDRNIFASVFGIIAQPFIRFGLWLSKWELNAGKAYLGLPNENKEYIVVRTTDQERKKIKKEGLDAHTDDDNTISHAASLHQNPCLVAMRKQSSKEKELAIAREMKVDKEKLPDHYHCKKINGHTVPMNALVNANGQSASRFFRDFVIGIAAKNHSRQEESTEDTKEIEVDYPEYRAI